MTTTERLARLAMLVEGIGALATPAVWRDPYVGTPTRLAEILAEIPDAEPPEHDHTYRADIADWWCLDCDTVTDYCSRINPS